MKPTIVEDLIQEHLDGRLGPEGAQRLRALLKGSAAARRLRRLEALRLGLRGSRPEPTAEQSRRMWEAIRARCAPEIEPARAERRWSWPAWLTRPWAPAWGVGLAGACAAALFVFLLFPRTAPRSQVSLSGVPARTGVPEPVRSARPVHEAGLAVGGAGALAAFGEEAPRRGRRRRMRSGSPVPALTGGSNASPAVAAVPILGGVQVQAPAPLGPGATEVEQALADSRTDALIGQFLGQGVQEQVPVVAMLPPVPSQASQAAAEVSYEPGAAPALDEAQGSAVAGVPRGGKGSDGYWNWTPAAQAMNGRDWNQARVELSAAAVQAGSAAERAFALSALGLLTATGGPLEGAAPEVLPAPGRLEVLQAGTWQLLVDSRLARFGGGVSVRLPGLREQGDSFLLDLGFNRGQFSPGSHFVRVDGRAPAKVLDASGQPVTASDFYAPAGADYDLHGGVLRLR